MDILNCLEPEPNRKQYVLILRGMTGEERVRIGFELFAMAKDIMAKDIMIEGIKAQNPNISSGGIFYQSFDSS